MPFTWRRPRFDIPNLAVSDYKGVSYARKFPDSERVYERASPFGYLEVYSSSYLHFAPGLSDNAAFNLPAMPANAYLGLYIDGEGPSGIIRDLPANETAYFRYLPMIYPYLIKAGARHLRRPVRRRHLHGGGAARAAPRRVTVAEGNPAVLAAFRTDQGLRDFTGDVLNNAKIKVIDYEGRLYLAHTKDRFDIVDLSLADSAGLSNPGGFAIVEKFAYSREAMASYMRALKDGGVLSVTLWNKEEPPKSVLKLYATMAEAARQVDGGAIADRFFVVSSYLSTATVLYKRGGFTPAEIDQAARAYPRHVVRRDLLSGLRLRRQGRRRPSSTTTATRSSPTGRRRTRPHRPMPPSRARGRRRRTPRFPPRPWARWPGTTWCTAAGTMSPGATCSTRACSPTTGPTSRPT